MLIIGLLLVVVVAFVIKNSLERKKTNKILSAQNEEINKQKNEAQHQRHLVEEKNKEILDSITYAKRIQTAILPPMSMLKTILPNSFIFYKPKDIVAGDFYWLEKKHKKTMFAAADCAGHGVPGAMVSVVCNNALNRAVREYGYTNPSKILDKTREIVIQEFEKSDEEVKDGMDISLCVLNTKTNVLQWSGANNPLWIVKKLESSKVEMLNNTSPSELTALQPSNLPTFELIEYKADKQPIGKYAEQNAFKTNLIELQKGDTLYIFTDGYADQFGGEKGKKYTYKRLREKLLAIANKNDIEQKQILDVEFENWKGNGEQIDDVCLVGIKI